MLQASQLPPADMMEWRHPVSGRLFHIDLRTGHSIAIGPPRQAHRTTIVNRASLNKGITITPLRPPERAIEVSDDEFDDAELDAIMAWIPLPTPTRQVSGHGLDVGLGVQGEVLAAITRSALEQARVLDQVDGKFIVCITMVERQQVVFCVDQHAADERYQLERFLEEYATRCADRTAAHIIEAAVTIDVSTNQYESLKSTSVRREMRRLGWMMQLVPRMAQVDISGVPYVLKDRTLTLKGRPKNQAMLRDVFASCLEDITRRQTDLEQHRRNGQGEQKIAQTNETGDWISFTRLLPAALLEVVKSKACRSAIMFNDAVGREVCERIVRRLTKCKFPFQCAHGRPTLVPNCQIVSQPSNDS
jgi:DNA mismatch repair ATPase MutL